MNIYNIAIVAHVDHGKTTLVDSLLKASTAFDTHKGLEERAMDSNAQEKERGITIYAKNASILYKGNKINIVDTPGHADFGSEVERVLRMVDAVVLVVDAYEGPMPQTKFVLKKSLQLGHKVLVVINKIDKPMARPDEVVDLTFDLFAQLGASDEQLDFPYVYAIAKQGVVMKNLDDPRVDVSPLLDLITGTVKEASVNQTDTLLFQPASLGYDSFVGRLAIGRIYDGEIKVNQQVFVKKENGETRSGRVAKLYNYHGMEKIEVASASKGDIIAIAGLSDIYVGETITNLESVDPLPSIKVDPPSLAIDFMVNDSPFAGREGKFVTSRHIRDRIEKELETNVGLKIEFQDNNDCVKVFGRGEMHIAVLIESMRREGFELQISQPQVITQEIDGVLNEPFEIAIVNVPDEMAGSVIQALSQRKGIMRNMQSKDGFTSLEFEIPTRGLLGFRSNFLVMTRGEGTLYHAFDSFKPHVGPIPKRTVGSMISGESGSTMAYSLWKLQERGPLFVDPAVEIYEGMVIGEHNQGSDLVVNATKNKKLTNVRASGTDEALTLTPIVPMTLERAIEYIGPDEFVEITPKSIRLRKKYLKEHERKKNK